jgi:hypothetical protein
MEVVMDNQELQNSIAKIADALITTEGNLVTVSRSLWAVRISLRELHPDFEEKYLNHFAKPEQAFDAMRVDRKLPKPNPLCLRPKLFSIG